MKKLKLICPICDTQFDTTRRNKIYCTIKCRKKKTRIDKLREEAIRKQQRMTEPYLYYDYDADNFYVSSIREQAQK
jgi:hypothetical protein